MSEFGIIHTRAGAHTYICKTAYELLWAAFECTDPVMGKQ